MDKPAPTPSVGHNIANGATFLPGTTWLIRAASPPIARCSRALTLGPCKRAFRCAPLGFSKFSVRNRLHRSRSFHVKTGSYRRRKIRYALLTTSCPHLTARLHVANVETRLHRVIGGTAADSGILQPRSGEAMRNPMPWRGEGGAYEMSQRRRRGPMVATIDSHLRCFFVCFAFCPTPRRGVSHGFAAARHSGYHLHSGVA